MFTLKIHWTRHKSESPETAALLVDESISFVEADKVVVHSVVNGNKWEEELKHWELDSYTNSLGVIEYDNGHVGEIQYVNGRLITVERNGEFSWYLASRAWLIGPDGKTIERLAP